MPATQTITTVNPTHTQVSLVTAIKNAFAAAGYPTPYADATSGTDRFLVYQLVFDAAKTYGTTYLRLKITSAMAVTQLLCTAWNIGTSTPTNAGTESTATTFTGNLPIEVRTFAKADEFRLIAMSQGTAFGLFGYVRPATKNLTFDEDICPYCFQSNNNWSTSSNFPFQTWVSTLLTPYTGGTTTPYTYTSSMGNIALSAANPANNRRDIIGGVFFYPNSNQGVAAKTSGDFASVAGTGLSRFDSIVVTSGAEEYTLIFPYQGALGIRVI